MRIPREKLPLAESNWLTVKVLSLHNLTLQKLFGTKHDCARQSCLSSLSVRLRDPAGTGHRATARPPHRPAAPSRGGQRAVRVSKGRGQCASQAPSQLPSLLLPRPPGTGGSARQDQRLGSWERPREELRSRPFPLIFLCERLSPLSPAALTRLCLQHSRCRAVRSCDAVMRSASAAEGAARAPA